MKTNSQPLVAGRLLLIEDDEGNALVTSLLLEEAGFTVDIAPSLAEARQCLSGGRYAQVLLDNRLGDGQGLELLPELRAQLPAARIVLLSGDGDPHQPMAAGIDGVLIKGGDFSDILALLGQPCAG